ncbi:hypothetical protein SRB5_05510 [Streptomyces sp. RB5]|uniref:ABM domain-containing protein n=1 Tax=Streptomyces smaragdinus TaxID=2585196 RepID=A0A7K0CAM6_9ACTN|nr:hypothetical protein [Streptomyces smaragdinus]MQY10443.1 hypothetical protein [Streptomyces smaragdinus]
MTFVQIIEYETDRPEEVNAVFDEWLKKTEGKRTVTRESHGRDREDSRHYVDIVEFPSYEQAMTNSNLPETQRTAQQLRDLCTGEPRFVDLDVVGEF